MTSHLPGIRSLPDVTAEALDTLGGSGTTHEIVEAVRHRATGAELDEWRAAALADAVRRALRHKARGQRLPSAINVNGTYKQRELFDADDYLAVITRRVEEGAASFGVARALAHECHERFGVAIDVDRLIANLAAHQDREESTA